MVALVATAGLALTGTAATAAPVQPGAISPDQPGAATVRYPPTSPGQPGMTSPVRHPATSPGRPGVTSPVRHPATSPARPGEIGPRTVACAGATCPNPGTVPRALSAYLLVNNESEPIGTGSGFALVDISTDWTRVCYVVNVVGLNSGPTVAHIHHGAAGVDGPVVVAFTAPVGGVAAGCTTVEPMLAADIANHSADYYVNVHTGLAPAGAIRGQLTVAPLCTIGCVRPAS